MLTTLVSSKDGAYSNAQKTLETKIALFNQSLQDAGLKISIGECFYLGLK
jgi:hypothetical protein